jgi:uncharacterized protein (TIGR02598 family)
MHVAGPPTLHPTLRQIPPARFRQAGFSLVEISLAIGIIAFAFVGLIGLLPVGLTTFRDAIDTSNEARIVQSFTSKLLATEFSKVPDLSFEKSKEIYYYDEEGMPVDTATDEIPSRKNDRLYECKVFIEENPNAKGAGVRSLDFSVNAVIVFANIASPADAEFQANQTLDDLRNELSQNKGKTRLQVRSILVSKMDGQPST